MMDFSYAADEFTRLCLTYPEEPMPGMFHRFMYLVPPEDRKALAPMFPLLVRVAESAREQAGDVGQCLRAELEQQSSKGGQRV